ncbi:hypothetical protein ABZ203_30435, partial [Streptomyces albidoflavus]
MTPPTPQEPPAGPPTHKALRSLLPVLAAHRAMTARTCAAALVDQAALVALVTLAAHTVGTAVIDGRPPSAGTVALLVALVAVRALATWREMDLSHDLAYRVLALLRVRVFDGIARSAPARIAGRRSGDLASTALGDVEALEFFYAHALAQLLATGTVFTASAALLGTREPWLLALAITPAGVHELVRHGHEVYVQLTLTLPAIRAAREVWLLAAGEDKANAAAIALS